VERRGQLTNLKYGKGNPKKRKSGESVCIRKKKMGTIENCNKKKLKSNFTKKNWKKGSHPDETSPPYIKKRAAKSESALKDREKNRGAPGDS